MKKIFLTIAIFFVVLTSCKIESKSESNSEFTEIFNSKELLELQNKITEPKEKYNFYKHLFLVKTFEDLKNNDEKELIQLKNYSDKTLVELSKIIISEYTTNDNNESMDSIPSFTGLLTRNQINFKLDSVISNNQKNLDAEIYEAFVGTLNGGTRIESINDNLVTLVREFGTGASLYYTNVIVENNKVTNLGQVYDYLKKSEYAILENEIFKINKNFSSPSSRENAKIEKTKENNYLISFRGYTNDDAGCCPSLFISYETKDYVTIIPNSTKVVLPE